MLCFQRIEGQIRKPLSPASAWDQAAIWCINPPCETGACVCWLLSYPALHPTPPFPKHRHRNTQRPRLELERLRSGGGGGEGKGLQSYQNSICRDPSRIGITPQVYGLGPGLGRMGKHQLAGEGVVPWGWRLCQVHWGWEGLFSSLPRAPCPIYLFLSGTYSPHLWSNCYFPGMR